MKTYEIEVSGGKFVIQQIPEIGWKITSEGIKNDHAMDEEDNAFNAAIDGVESFLLALASEGVDLDDPKIRNAVNVSVEAIDAYK